MERVAGTLTGYGKGTRWWRGRGGDWTLAVSGTGVVVSREVRGLQGLRGKRASLGKLGFALVPLIVKFLFNM